MFICRNTPRPLFYSFFVFAEREGRENVVYTPVFTLRFTDFRWGVGTGPWSAGHGEEDDAAAAAAGGAQARARSSLGGVARSEERRVGKECS